MPKVLIAGGTGLVGLRLSQLLSQQNYEVRHLSRKANPSTAYPTFVWNPKEKSIDKRALEGVDYVINLAGAGIADALWTKSRKKLIIDSRVDTTQLLTKAIKEMDNPPKAYLSAAAIGIYGNRGDEILTEDSPIGTKGFLVESCKAWEAAIHEAATQNGIRTVALRIGIVLSTKGGALPKMLLPLKLFTASYFGDGKQWYAWIHIDDVCRMFLKAMEDDSIEGFYNATAPNPLTNKALTKQMVKTLGKRAFIVPAPTATLRIGMGEMADVVLNSNRVLPKRMETAGFAFDFPDFKMAVKDVVSEDI